MTNDPKKKQATLADELRATIERTELLHAEIFAKDKPANGTTFVGRRSSEAMLKSSQGTELRVVARGMFAPCMREIGGCGGCGFIGAGERRVCPICLGCGNRGVLSEAGLELIRAILFALAPQLKPDATPEALEAHNVAAAEAERQRQEARLQREASRMPAPTMRQLAQAHAERVTQELVDEQVAANNKGA